MKKIYSLMLTLLALTGVMSSCSEQEEIVFEHELQQFETRSDRILLEFIAPFGTTAEEEIYILGAFNGDSAAIGNEQYLLTKVPNSDIKWGVYLDAGSFVSGKSLADGFRFYSATQGMEYTIDGEAALHKDNPAVGTFANVWGQRWEAYYWEGGEAPEPEHDGFAVFVDDQTGWDVLTLYMWGDVNDLNGGWPGMAVTGTWNHDGINWKYFDMGEANTGLVENLIFNNGGNGQQLADFNFTIDRDVYLRITVDGVEEIGSEPAVKHDGYAVFVIDDTEWEALNLYMWGDVNDLNGGWPGMEVTGEQTIGSYTYKYFDMGEANTGLNENLIFSNAGSGQLPDFAYTIDHDVYLHITASSIEEIDPSTYQGGGQSDEPEPEPEPTVGTFNIYVNNQTGWDALALYAWGDGLPELFGGWPGNNAPGSANVAGTDYLAFSYESAAQEYHLIFNNNGDGSQYDGPVITTGNDFYLNATATECQNITCKLYIDDQTGWDAVAIYAWGDGLPELYGGWPGKNVYGTETIDNVTYKVFAFPATGQVYNPIYNNNGGGAQYDGPAITLDKDYFFSINSNGWTAK